MHLIFIVAVCIPSMVLSKAESTENLFSSILLNLNEEPKNLTILEKWQNLEKIVKGEVNNIIKMILPQLMEISGTMNISSQCRRDGMKLINGLRTIKPWAMKFLDSSGKIIDGLIIGSLSSFGTYDECVDTEVRSTKLNDKGRLFFRGQYCTIDMTPPLPPKNGFYRLDKVLDELKNFSERDTAIAKASKFAHLFYFVTYRLGICVPSGCSLEDIDKVAKQFGQSLYLNASATRCEVKEEANFTPLIIAIITCYSFTGFLMLIGSLIDLYGFYMKITFRSNIIRVLVAFSLFTNFRKFINTETSSDTLSCLNGVRFLSMSWIILAHTYLFVNYQLLLGLEKIMPYAGDFAFQAVINASVAVDTFFFIGGLLVCYVTIRHVRVQGKKFGIGLYIFHRLWRLLPAYVYVIMFLLLGHLLGSGPIYHEMTDTYIKDCQKNWWTNIIFINNFYDAKHMCIPHTWYIASDFQLYIGTLIILLPMIRWPKVGVALSIIVIIACVIYSGVVTYINKYPPTMLFSNADPGERMPFYVDFYYRPFAHAGSYSIGILTGYLLATKPDLKISPFVRVLGWSFAFIFNFSVLYGVVEWNRGAEVTVGATIFYASFNRVVWTLGIAWMVIACSTGYGGVINYILSWKAFIPLGRLTFVAYLIHPIIQTVFMGNLKTVFQPDHFFGVWIYFGYLCVTFGTAFAGSMLIESPFMSLEKIILPQRGEKDNVSTKRKNSILKCTPQTELNGDFVYVVPKNDEESVGIDNIAAEYKL